jgi:hypothetical protein
MNTAFGPAEELIFDLRHHRWPICYELADSNYEAIRKTRRLLGEQFEIALRSAMENDHQAVEDASRRLSAETIMVMGWHADQIFFWRDRSDDRILQAAAMGFIDRAYDRLLDLELIDCVFYQNLNRFVYRWTYIGKLVLKKLDIKSTLSPFKTEKAIENSPEDARRRFQEMRLRERIRYAFFPRKLNDH